jgi:transglutaminase-like putative cysteine protease
VNLVGLITPARPVWVSHPSELFFTQVPQGKMDPVQILSDSPVLAGEKYEVHANEYQPTIIQLQYAGRNYPEWVTKAYLQLPDRLSLDVVALAHRITADATNPYDMADAITKYLRDNYTYSNTVVAPPPGRDPVDWFLFDSKKGFCNYFATAEVILLRSAGVPARLVVGFAQGEFASPDTYTVRQQDSHAWPEVYFPGAGWVEFEPTTSQTPLTRPLGDSRASAGQVSTEGPASEARQGGKGQKLPAWAQAEAIGIDLGSRASAVFFLRLILICAIIATILNIYTFSAFNNPLEADQQVIRGSLPILLKQLFEKRALTPPGWLEQWAFQSELNPIERSFRTIYRSLQWLGEKAPPSQTPAEAADELKKLLPGASQEINSLLNEYQRHYYSEKHASLNIARRDMNAIRRETLHVAIRQRLRALRDIFRRGSF